MSRKRKADNEYSFTTTEQDHYLRRVSAEATPDTDFIVITEKDAVRGRGNSAYLLVRKESVSLGFLFPDLTLAGRTLSAWITDVLELSAEEGTEGVPYSDWAVATVTGKPDALASELVRLRNEIRRIRNLQNNKTVRVNVESF